MAGLLGALGGLASGLISSVTGNSQLKQQLQFQREENEKTREYNRKLAEQQNQWNIEQWNRENQYNTPEQMRARLEAAGYNPNLAVSGLSGSLNSARSPELTAGAPGIPTDFNALGRMDNPAAAGFRGAIEAIQARNIESQTDKIKTETNYQKLVSEYLPAQILSGLKVSDATAREIVERSKNYEFEARRINQEINKMEQDINLSKAQGKQTIAYSDYVDALKKNLADRLTLDWYKESNFVKNYSRQLDIDESKLAEVCRQFDFEQGLLSDGVEGSPIELQRELLSLMRRFGIKETAFKNSTMYLNFAADKIGQVLNIGKGVLETRQGLKSLEEIGKPTRTTVRRFEELYDESGNVKGSRMIDERRRTD
uniref:DNA pilot protein n=1 Tax=Dulem virus 262 TaxID=3145739 RepID=A0AAU8AV22_9VIRU